MSVDSPAATAAPRVSTPSVPCGAQVDLAGVPHSYPLSRDLEYGWLHLPLCQFSPTARAHYEVEVTKPDQLAALYDIDLTVAPGESVLPVGPFGCGKLTILRLLAGLEQPVEDSITVGSTQVTGSSPLHAPAFQDTTLLPWKTVQDNITLGPEARGWMECDRCRVKATLQLVGLRDFIDSYPPTLSGNMAQRASLIRALVNRPRLFPLDEPLGKLDALTHPQLRNEILRLWEFQRLTAVLVTHDMDEVLCLSNRVVVLSGRPVRVVVDIEVPGHDKSSDEVRELRRRTLGLLGR